LELREAPRERAELAAENAALGRAVGELASENAELYRRVGELTAELKQEKARHDAWAKEMSVRDRMRTSREEALTSRVEDLEVVVAELRGTADPGSADRRVGHRAVPDVEKARDKEDRTRFSNEFIDEGVQVGSGVLTAVGVWLGTATASDSTALTISALASRGRA
jgi:predicted RNase H-like nuclease (RuvC/YqgF family)